MSLIDWVQDPFRYRRVQAKLVQFFKYRGSREAEDLAQDTYLQVLALERNGKVIVRSDQIFLVVARFLWLKRCREAVRWESLERPDGSLVEVSAPDEVHLLDLVIYMEQLMDLRLSDKDRKLLNMSLESETTAIARILGLPEASVRVRLSQIRAKLRTGDAGSRKNEDGSRKYGQSAGI